MTRSAERLPAATATPRPRSVFDTCEVAMPPCSLRKPDGTVHALGFEDVDAVSPLTLHRVAHAQAMLQVHGSPIGPNTRLGETGDLARQGFGFLASGSRAHDPLARADRQAFLCGHFPTGENDVERAAASDE